MTKQSFIKGAMILLAAGIINRILGFIPRIALPRMIGAEGIGLYQMAYPLMIVILTIITGGIPLAVSKLVAEADAEGRPDKIKATVKIALTITITGSMLFTALSLWFASYITTNWFTDSRVYYAYISMTPILLIAGISSVLRGYFQGLQNMIPTALSQTAETLIRIIVALLLAYMLLPLGVQYAAAGAMIGVVAGEAIGLLVLAYPFLKKRPPSAQASTAANTHKPPALFRQLFRVAIPVTASRLVGSGSYFAESIMTVQGLAAAGIATAVATTQYGVLQGMVLPILLLPTALTYSLAVSLVPSLSEAALRNDHRTVHKRLHQSLMLSMIAGAPFAIIMYVLADPLCRLIFNHAEAGAMLKMMAPIALFIYFQGPLQAALQALERPGTALINTLIGAIAKLTLIAILAAKPNLGIYGVVIAINVNIALVTALHWFSVTKLLKFSMPAIDFLKVSAAIGLAGVSCSYVWKHTGYALASPLRLTAAIFAALLVYLLGCIALRLIDREDLRRLVWMYKKFKKQP
jgi:stage V sporulation protein B